MPTVLWFRRDLRLRDLPVLLAAASDGDDVLACFVLDPRLEASSGPRRMQYLSDSLRQLRDDLDGRLLVTRGRPEERIPLIANDVSARAVHVSDDFAPFGRRRDELVRAALGELPLVGRIRSSSWFGMPMRMTPWWRCDPVAVPTLPAAPSQSRCADIGIIHHRAHSRPITSAIS